MEASLFHIFLYEIIDSGKQSTFLHSNPEIRGNLNPPVLAKNKGTAVFRLVSARTDFSSEKSSCCRPTSEGICFAKQSEQWVTKPLLSQGEVSESVPLFRGYYVERGTTCIILLIVDVPKGNPALSPS